MSVVLRCPSCGTSQATSGPCQACHEADVRYFCDAHEPGHWLDGPRCPLCDAPRAVPPPELVLAPREALAWAPLDRSATALVARGLGCVLRLLVVALVLLVGLGVAVFWYGYAL